MKQKLSVVFLAVIIMLWLFGISTSYAGIVTVDVAGKDATCDSPSLRVRAKQVKVKDDQVGLIVESTVNTAQNAVLKFNGIKDQNYDVYINGSYTGEQPAKILQSGLSLPIPGTVANPIMMRCLNALSEKVKSEYKRLQKIKGTEPQRVSYTLSQADDWIRSGINADQAYRSADIIIGPAGLVLHEMKWRTRSTAEDTASTVTRACWLLQQARNRMYTVIKDPELRNSAVATLTPVDLTATYSLKNGKPHIEATVLNNCNITINGAIEISSPKGWKTNAKGLSFDNLKSGKTFKISFDLAPVAKDAAVPQSVPLAASISLKQDNLAAKFTLNATAAAK